MDLFTPYIITPGAFGGSGGGVLVTWNPADKDAGVTLSGGDLVANGDGDGNNAVRATLAKDSGSYVYEVTVTTQDNSTQIGIGTSSANLASFVGSDANGWGYHQGGNIFNNGGTAATFTSYTTGNVIGVAINMTANTIEFFLDGASEGTQSIAAGSWFPMVSVASVADTLTANFGATAFSHTYTGYTAWNA